MNFDNPDTPYPVPTMHTYPAVPMKPTDVEIADQCGCFTTSYSSMSGTKEGKSDNVYELDDADIEIVMSQIHCDRDLAGHALVEADGDLVSAILKVSFIMESKTDGLMTKRAY